MRISDWSSDLCSSDLYDQLGRYDLAERYYQRALAMDLTSVQTLNNLGYSLLLQGKPELALTFFRDAARIAPDNTVIAANAEQAVTARDRKSTRLNSSH